MASPPPSPSPSKKPKMSTTSSSDPEPESAVAAEPKLRYKRRKVAIFLAYCGFGYQGMQKNPGARTIESDLEEALFLSGAVPESDKSNSKRYDWARSARTDKGVSAAGQVVSGRFYIDPPGFVERMNSNLSGQIRVFGFKRVTNSFSAKKFCDRRRYVYLLPVFALDPNSHPDRESVMASVGSGNELVKCVECSERGRKVAGVMGRQPRVSDEEENGQLGAGVGGLDEKVEFCSGELKIGEAAASKFEEESNLGASDAVVEATVATVEVKCETVDCELKSSEEESSRPTEKGSLAETRILTEELSNNTSNLGEAAASKFEEESNLGAYDAVVETTVATVEVKCETVDCELKYSEEESNGPTEEGSLAETRILTEELSNNASNGKKNSLEGISKYEYGDKERERFNGILKRYVGTHNFHNFTTRTKAEDPSARRYIISFNADCVISIDGIDFVRCEVVGQSFMLHQIRKMIGLAVAMMRNCCPDSLMDVALRKDININVPTAPEVGLYLDECFFSSYNQKWKDSHEELSMDGYAEQAEEFKLKHIFSHIAVMEHKEGAVALWLHSLNHRNYPDFRFQQTNGTLVNSEHDQIDKSEN